MPISAPIQSDEQKTPLASGSALAVLRGARRAVVFVVGTTVVLVGIVMIVAPGPAVIVIPLGLGILATEFVWARRLLGSLKSRLADAHAAASQAPLPRWLRLFVPKSAPQSAPAPLPCPMCGATLSEGATKCANCGEPIAQPPPKPRFRWRIFPTVFLALMSVMFVVAGAIQLGMAIVRVGFGGSSPIVAFHALLLGGAAIVPGAVWGLAARMWWQGKWRWAIVWTILGYPAG